MTNENGKWPLPEGWVWTTLGEVSTLVGGGTPSRQIPEYFGDDFVWLTPTEIPKTRVSVVSTSRERISKLGLQKSSAKIIPKGSVLLTSRASIGYVAIAGTDLTTNQGFASFIPIESVNNNYLAYWLKNIADDLEAQATGTTFKEISKSKLREFSIPLPPLPTQHHIVAEIEKQFTRLDAAVAALRRAKANLARYKAAVLKAAVEGRLVARPQRSSETSEVSASVLLQRILAERRARWEAANPKKQYVEPKRPDVDGLPELPEGWVWATVEEVLENHDARRIPIKREDRANMQGVYPYYGASGIIDYVDKFIFDGEYLLIAEDGANLLARSTPIAFQAHGQFWVNNHAHIVQCLGNCPLGYIETYFNSIDLSFLITGTAQPKLTQANLNRIAIPFPPLNEQRRIVDEIERNLSIIHSTEQAIDANLARAERLRQAVLARAFRGELV